MPHKSHIGKSNIGLPANNMTGICQCLKTIRENQRKSQPRSSGPDLRKSYNICILQLANLAMPNHRFEFGASTIQDSSLGCRIAKRTIKWVKSQ